MHISNRNKKAFVFRIHLYKVNSSQKPLEEIEILNNSFTINNKDKGIIKINVQDNQIELPLGQVLLTVELITMQSKSCINIQSSSYLGNNDYSFLRIANRPWNDLTDILTYRSKAPVKQNLKIGVDIFD